MTALNPKPVLIIDQELGITKIVLLVRQRSGKTLAERIQKLRSHTMFDEVARMCLEFRAAAF